MSTLLNCNFIVAATATVLSFRTAAYLTATANVSYSGLTAASLPHFIPS